MTVNLKIKQYKFDRFCLVDIPATKRKEIGATTLLDSEIMVASTEPSYHNHCVIKVNSQKWNNCMPIYIAVVCDPQCACVESKHAHKDSVEVSAKFQFVGSQLAHIKGG